MCRDQHTQPDAERPIHGWTIGILGYGNQGQAQALNLRDAGYEILVGAREGRPSIERAARAGFPVVDPASLADACDLVALLTPDETHGTLLASLAKGERTKTVVLAHGYALRFAEPKLREDWDVLLVAPAGPGTSLRREGVAGRIPAVIAVHRDASGMARQRATAFAVAAGCAPDALLEATVAEEVEIDLFGEQAVLCGGLAALVTAAWETLVEHGYDPELAYLECVHQIGLTAEMITRFGVTGMRERISPVALFGDLTRGGRLIGPKVRHSMAELLGEIRNNRFAEEWAREVAAGYPRSREGLGRSRRHPLEAAARRMRGATGRGKGEGGGGNRGNGTGPVFR